VAALIDEEIKGIVGEGHDKAGRILTRQRAKIDVVVERLKIDETIDARFRLGSAPRSGRVPAELAQHRAPESSCWRS